MRSSSSNGRRGAGPLQGPSSSGDNNDPPATSRDAGMGRRGRQMRYSMPNIPITPVAGPGSNAGEAFREVQALSETLLPDSALQRIAPAPTRAQDGAETRAQIAASTDPIPIHRVEVTFTVPFSSSGFRTCLLGKIAGDLNRKLPDRTKVTTTSLDLPGNGSLSTYLQNHGTEDIRLVEVFFRLRYSFLDKNTNHQLQLAMKTLLPLLGQCELAFHTTIWDVDGKPHLKHVLSTAESHEKVVGMFYEMVKEADKQIEARDVERSEMTLRGESVVYGLVFDDDSSDQYDEVRSAVEACLADEQTSDAESFASTDDV